MSLPTIIAVLQATVTLLTLVQAHPGLGQSVRDRVLQVSQQAVIEATSQFDTALRSSSTEPVSAFINVPTNLPSSLSPASVQRTCPVVVAPSCSTELTVIRDGYNCVTGFYCAEANVVAKRSEGVESSSSRKCTYNGAPASEASCGDVPANCKSWGKCPAACSRPYPGGPATCTDQPAWCNTPPGPVVCGLYF